MGVDDNKWSVYKHTAPCGKCYIGITCKPPEQRWEYGKGYRHNAHMQSAIEKYGWESFEHEILAVGLSQDEALSMEREMIAKYKSADRRYGYNIELGGRKKNAFGEETLEKMRVRMLGENNPNYGKHLSEETRKKLSEINRGEKHPKYGTHHSEETRRKLSEQKRGEKNYNYGKHPSDETIQKHRATPQCKPVKCVETGVIYPSVREASRQTGVNISGICLAIKGERLKTSGGYHWEYV